MCFFKKSCSVIWKLVSVFGALFGIVMGLYALYIGQKNQEYKDALIDLSDSFPEDGVQTPKEEWQTANAPENRKTTEERLKDNRITEEA